MSKLVMMNVKRLIYFLFLISCSSILAQDAKELLGKASFYASKFNGRKTANGELFSQDSLTAAHKYLPFGTLVKVINLKNDCTVVVRINDRLPKHSSRAIDLSLNAARKIMMTRNGIVKVRMEILKP